MRQSLQLFFLQPNSEFGIGQCLFLICKLLLGRLHLGQPLMANIEHHRGEHHRGENADNGESQQDLT